MASIFSRLFKMGQSEAHAAVDKFEDPIKMTEQGIRDLKGDLQKAVTSLAQVKGIAIKLKRQKDEQVKLAAEYERKAVLLLQKGQSGGLNINEAERLARESLAKKEDAAQEALTLSKQWQQQDSAAEKLQSNIGKLRSTVSSYENDLITLKARAKTAQATKKINQQLANVDSSGTIAMLEKMKARVEDDEVMAEAYGGMLEDSQSDIDDQINRALTSGTDLSLLESGSKEDNKLDDQLAQLKAKIGA